MGLLSDFCRERRTTAGRVDQGFRTTISDSRARNQTLRRMGRLTLCIDAVNVLKLQYQIQPQDVEQVVVSCASRLYENRQIRRPQSIMAGQMSMPFITALAFFHDLRDPEVWKEEILSDERILQFLDRVECRVDEEIEKHWRAAGGQGEVKIIARLKGGVEKSATVAHSKGTSENPMTEEEIREKFLLLAGRRLPPERCTQVVTA